MSLEKSRPIKSNVLANVKMTGKNGSSKNFSEIVDMDIHEFYKWKGLNHLKYGGLYDQKITKMWQLLTYDTNTLFKCRNFGRKSSNTLKNVKNYLGDGPDWREVTVHWDYTMGIL